MFSIYLENKVLEQTADIPCYQSEIFSPGWPASISAYTCRYVYLPTSTWLCAGQHSQRTCRKTQGSQRTILLPHPIPTVTPFCFVLELPGQEVGTQVELLKAGSATGECGGSQTKTSHQDKLIHCKFPVLRGHRGSSWALLGLGAEAALLTAPWNLPETGIKRFLQRKRRDRIGERRGGRGRCSTLIQHNLEKKIMPY